MLSLEHGRISGIRPAPDIWYLAFRLAGYLAVDPEKSLSGASLVNNVIKVK
jgi:hypothetical protein